MAETPDHTWDVLGASEIYASPWVSVDLVTVRPPGTEPFDHHVVRVGDAASVLAYDPARGVLLLWRHRFMIDRHGWELPAGKIEPGESPEAAAARECAEETGWRPGPLRPLCEFAPAPGIMDHWFHAFLADGATRVGEPDPLEAAEVAWVPVADLPGLLTGGGMPDGPSLLVVSYALAVGALA